MYELAYDALNERYPFENFVMLGIWLIGLAVTLQAFLNFHKKQQKDKKGFIKIWLLGWIVLGGIGFGNVFYQQSQCVKWRQEGLYTITEGIVESFDPMPREGHKSESFRLQNYRFSYSDFSKAKGCFNQTKSHGGLIDEGKRVKIYHHNGVILRIEVWRG